VGAYHPGSNPAIDEAIAKHQPIEDFLIQEIDERTDIGATFATMEKISGVPIPRDELPGASETVAGKSPVSAKTPEQAPAENWSNNSVAALFAGRSMQT
jgi:flagellum-specific ATP synthase